VTNDPGNRKITIGKTIMRTLCSLLCILFLASAVPARADNAQPNQVVQNLVDDLGKTMESRRDELSKNREALLKTIDGIVLPHFDIDYASLLVLGQNAHRDGRTARTLRQGDVQLDHASLRGRAAQVHRRARARAAVPGRVE